MTNATTTPTAPTVNDQIATLVAANLAAAAAATAALAQTGPTPRSHRYDGALASDLQATCPEMQGKWEFAGVDGAGIHRLLVTDCDGDEVNMLYTIRVSGKTGESWIRSFSTDGTTNNPDILCDGLLDAKCRIEGEAYQQYGPGWVDYKAELAAKPPTNGVQSGAAVPA